MEPEWKHLLTPRHLLFLGLVWYTQGAIEIASVLESDGLRFELPLNYSLVVGHREVLKSVP